MNQIRWTRRGRDRQSQHHHTRTERGRLHRPHRPVSGRTDLPGLRGHICRRQQVRGRFLRYCLEAFLRQDQGHRGDQRASRDIEEHGSRCLHRRFHMVPGLRRPSASHLPGEDDAHPGQVLRRRGRMQLRLFLPAGEGLRFREEVSVQGNGHELRGGRPRPFRGEVPGDGVVQDLPQEHPGGLRHQVLKGILRGHRPHLQDNIRIGRHMLLRRAPVRLLPARLVLLQQQHQFGQARFRGAGCLF